MDNKTHSGRHCRPAVLRGLVAAALLLTASAGAGSAWAAPAATQEQIARGTELCAQADGLLSQDKKAEARKIYQEVLTFLPESPRAQKGLKACGAAGAPASASKAGRPAAGSRSRKAVSLTGKTLCWVMFGRMLSCTLRNSTDGWDRMGNVSAKGPCCLVTNADGMLFSFRAGDRVKDDKGAVWISREVRIGDAVTYPFLRESFSAPYAARNLKAPKPANVEDARRRLTQPDDAGSQPANQ